MPRGHSCSWIMRIGPIDNWIKVLIPWRRQQRFAFDSSFSLFRCIDIYSSALRIGARIGQLKIHERDVGIWDKDSSFVAKRIEYIEDSDQESPE